MAITRGKCFVARCHFLLETVLDDDETKILRNDGIHSITTEHLDCLNKFAQNTFRAHRYFKKLQTAI